MAFESNESAVAAPNPTEKKRSIYSFHSEEHGEGCPRFGLQSPFRPKKQEAGMPLEPAPTCAELPACCPADIVVNASNRPLIVQADAHEGVRRDQQRIYPGDRRQGGYYTNLIGLEVGTGLQLVRDVPKDRLIKLEKERQIRTGERPEDWILIAREKAKQGHKPAEYDNVHMARANLERTLGMGQRGV